MFKSLLEGEEQNSLAQLIAILDPHFGVTALRRRSRLNMQMHDFLQLLFGELSSKNVFLLLVDQNGDLQFISVHICAYIDLLVHIFKSSNFSVTFCAQKIVLFTPAKSDQNFAKRRGRMNIDHLITFALLNLLQ